MTFELTGILLNNELYKAFLSFGDGIRILSPKNAVKHLRKTFREALKKYEPEALTKTDRSNVR